MSQFRWAVPRPDRNTSRRVGDGVAIGSLAAAAVGKRLTKKGQVGDARIPLLLSVAGHAVLAARVSKPQPTFRLLVGQAFSAAGDVAMAGKTETSTLVGIAMFAGTHLCSLYGYLTGATLRRVVARPEIAVGYAGAYALIARRLWPRLDARMRWPATAYGALLFATAIAAWATDSRCGVGATLFALSDVLIALRLAGVEFPSQRFLIYSTYAAGQYLVVRHGAASEPRQS